MSHPDQHPEDLKAQIEAPKAKPLAETPLRMTEEEIGARHDRIYRSDLIRERSHRHGG